MLGSEVKDQQALLIKSLNKKVILVPDRDENGLKLLEQAIELGWSVSMSDWEDEVKDAHDAVMKYGIVYFTHNSIREDSELKIKLRSKTMVWLKKLYKRIWLF